MPTPRNISVLKAFALLKSFSHPDECLTCVELSRRARLPEASCLRLLYTLEEIGAVVRVGRKGYRPGLALISLSSNVAVADCLREAGLAIINDLSRRLDVTVNIGMLQGGMVTYVAKAATPTSCPTHARIGDQFEPYCSGLGKVLLAALPPFQLDHFVQDALVALTPHTITDRATLLSELDTVRKCGYALDNRETSMDMICLAVPITNGDGQVVAAMSAAERRDAFTPERRADLQTELLAAAAAAGRRAFPESSTLLTRKGMR